MQAVHKNWAMKVSRGERHERNLSGWSIFHLNGGYVDRLILDFFSRSIVDGEYSTVIVQVPSFAIGTRNIIRSGQPPRSLASILRDDDRSIKTWKKQFPRSLEKSWSGESPIFLALMTNFSGRGRSGCARPMIFYVKCTMFYVLCTACYSVPLLYFVLCVFLSDPSPIIGNACQ